MLHHPAFKPLPASGQLAKNRSWETAWSFHRSTLPSPAEIDEYIADATEVAFEAFFGEAFFGVRVSGEPRMVAEFASSSVAALRDAIDGASFFSHFSRNVGLSGWGRSISFAEVGAVNAWQSVGSVNIALPREALQKFEAVWVSLMSTPLASNSSCRKAVEFACAAPLPHWFALPVSSSRPPFELNREALHQALESADVQPPGANAVCRA